MKYNVGDVVLCHVIAGETEFLIIATKEQPYDGRGSSPTNQLIIPNGENDYVIVESGLDEGVFGEFHHVQEIHLEDI